MCARCASRISEDLSVKKYVRVICRATHKKMLHAGLVLQTSVAVLVDELLNAIQIAFDYGRYVHNVPS